MDQIEGIVKVLGPSRTTLQAISVTTYSYIEIGDRVIKKIMVFEAMNGPLQLAVQNSGVATLFIKNGYLCGFGCCEYIAGILKFYLCDDCSTIFKKARV